MENIEEIEAEMELLEREAYGIFSNPSLTNFEKRGAFERLLSKFRVLADYKQALAIFIRRMSRMPIPSPNLAMDKILSSKTSTAFSMKVLATFIALTYAGGPRGAWVPFSFIPTFAPDMPTIRL